MAAVGQLKAGTEFWHRGRRRGGECGRVLAHSPSGTLVEIYLPPKVVTIRRKRTSFVAQPKKRERWSHDAEVEV